VISATFERTQPITGMRVESQVGAYASKVHYAPTVGAVYHAFQWDAKDAQGNKVPTGVYPALVTAHFAEAAFIAGTNIAVNRDIESKVTLEIPVAIQNNRTSPFGAGWSLEELDRLTMAPSGDVVWTSGDGAAAVYTPGLVTAVLAGSTTPGFAGDGGPVSAAALNGVRDLVFDSRSNLYVLDAGNLRVRRITPQGTINTVAGNGQSGVAPDGTAATDSPLSRPSALAIDAADNLYIAEFGPTRPPGSPITIDTILVRRVTPAGIISTYFAPSAFPVPDGIDRMAFDPRDGSLVAVHTASHRVIRLMPDGTNRPVAGTGTEGTAGDDGDATEAFLSSPTGVAIDAAGQVTIVDSGNRRVRQVDSGGVIRTIVGTGRPETAERPAEGVPALLADIRLGPGAGLAFTREGDLLIASARHRLIRRINANGTIRSIAGVPELAEDALASGTALDVQVGPPRVIAVGPDGQIAFSSNKVKVFDDPFAPIVPSSDAPNHYVRVLKTSSAGGDAPFITPPGRFAKLTRHADSTFTRRDRDGTIHRYSADGLKTAWQARNNAFATLYTYTPDRLLATITEPTPARNTRASDHDDR
jgi:hypothetical protein